MEGKRSLQSLTLRNILSFGPEAQTLELEPLNVLIGPNASGKSNLIEILGLLRSLPRDLSVPMRGIHDWLWKGETAGWPSEIHTSWEYAAGEPPLRHTIGLREENNRQRIAFETIDQARPEAGDCKTHYAYRGEGKSFDARLQIFDHVDNYFGAMASTGFRTDNSILSQKKDADRYPSMAFLEEKYRGVYSFRGCVFGPGSPLRLLQKADLPGDFLLEDASNLGVILHNLMLDSHTRPVLADLLKKLYEGAEEFRVRIVQGYVEINILEENEKLIPATRLSDGTLRYLSLLAILCHPDPPPLICIEEPELGLHPDLISTVAELLIKASLKTQLIVTTHSASLVSALGDIPESLVICEKHSDGTILKRLRAEEMKEWLEKYTLGDLWAMGELGGNRW